MSAHPAGAPLRVGVVGCGLIGGSVLRGLAGDPAVALVAHDPARATRDAVAALGIAVAEDAAALASVCDLVVVAAPPDATATCCAEALAAAPGAIVTDTASVKAPIRRAVAALVGEAASRRFVPGHPLAGRERPGFAAAAGDLFAGAVWALCPDPETPLAATLTACRLAWRLGASVLAVDAHRHDRAVAFSSHGPHLLASATARATLAEDRRLVALLSGGGLRDATRVAASDGVLWAEIVRANREQTLAAVRAERQALDAIERAVRDEDWEAFAALWEEGRRATAALLATRWSPARWHTVALEPPATRGLLALGAEGRLVRALRADGAVVSVEASEPPPER